MSTRDHEKNTLICACDALHFIYLVIFLSLSVCVCVEVDEDDDPYSAVHAFLSMKDVLSFPMASHRGFSCVCVCFVVVTALLRLLRTHSPGGVPILITPDDVITFRHIYILPKNLSIWVVTS